MFDGLGFLFLELAKTRSFIGMLKVEGVWPFGTDETILLSYLKAYKLGVWLPGGDSTDCKDLYP